MRFLKELRADSREQNDAEYTLVLGLVAVAAIVGVALLGTSLQASWTALGGYLGSLAP